MLDKFLAPNTHEAAAYFHLTENGPTWHTPVDESDLSSRASDSAFARYIGGEDLVIRPRTRVQLESILRIYAHNAIHNAIAVSRSQIQEGGYSRLLNSAEKSIRDVLNTGDNAKKLLALHQPNADDTKIFLTVHQPKSMTCANTEDTKIFLNVHQKRGITLQQKHCIILPEQYA